jgi:predicted nucleic acid-binding protein
MPFVLDASVVLDWALEEGGSAAEIARQRLTTDTGLVPSLWWFEVRNGLVVAERRRRTSPDISAAFLHRLSAFPLAVAGLPDESTLLTLARRHGLTVYDAAYLELALRERLDLATLDTELADAARAESVTLVG